MLITFRSQRVKGQGDKWSDILIYIYFHFCFLSQLYFSTMSVFFFLGLFVSVSNIKF